MNESLIDDIPEHGFIALDSNEGIAAAFLRRVEGSFGLLDGLITNPTADGKLRHEAIDLIVTEIIKLCRILEIKRLLAHSVDVGTLERSKKFGFISLPDTLIALKLR